MLKNPGSREPDLDPGDSNPNEGSKGAKLSAKILPFSVAAIMAKDESRPLRTGWRLKVRRCSPPTDPATSRTSNSTSGSTSAPSTPSSFSVDGILSCHRSSPAEPEALGSRTQGGGHSSLHSNEEKTSSTPSSNNCEATGDVPETGNSSSTPAGNRSFPFQTRSLEASHALGLTTSAVVKWSNELGYHPWIDTSGLQNSIVREYIYDYLSLK